MSNSPQQDIKSQVATFYSNAANPPDLKETTSNIQSFITHNQNQKVALVTVLPHLQKQKSESI